MRRPLCLSEQRLEAFAGVSFGSERRVGAKALKQEGEQLEVGWREVRAELGWWRCWQTLEYNVRTLTSELGELSLEWALGMSRDAFLSPT